ncbi:hypothetical protein VPMG_00098 [Vibrio phage VBP32]|uniref:Uncharacterized protein n=2 Tax=Stoningtonvirus VBP47 TaxID=2846606 RepID=M4SP30_9CAUD|nr:hypothetical protein VPNG_00031 [Vibrio phage VBP47]YP_007676588.1 hypothetical protein VPMG_00098 [Vibrio phage VBP32]AGH57055.1 hypothetical protein VPNG_00031 [Vibrio phage VBP47]AGH57237.1 hypothetical protein VPMG_00098 [Vibrio phage VBP32]WMM35557.1 hypothetical protein [Vibrio phage PJN101]
MSKAELLESIRNAIADAEEYGLCRFEDGTVITGAMWDPEDGNLVFTEDLPLT